MEVANPVKEVSKKELVLKVMPARKGDLAITIAEGSLSKEILGFTPKHSDLETIIWSEWESIQKN